MSQSSPKSGKAGVSLVEVMLAGAMTAVAVLVTLEGFIMATRVVHENAETLQADGIAFDLLWRKFYGDYDEMRNSNELKATTDDDSPYRSNSFSNAPPFQYVESVTNSYGGKMLYINVQYGPDNRFTRHLEVFRSEIPRIAN